VYEYTSRDNKEVRLKDKCRTQNSVWLATHRFGDSDGLYMHKVKPGVTQWGQIEHVTNRCNWRDCVWLAQSLKGQTNHLIS